MSERVPNLWTQIRIKLHDCMNAVYPAPPKPPIGYEEVSAILDAYARDIEALASSPSQPAGWKLVPIVADTKMADAMDLAVLQYSADGEYDPTATMRAMYAAALAAAPALVELKP